MIVYFQTLDNIKNGFLLFPIYTIPIIIKIKPINENKIGGSFKTISTNTNLFYIIITNICKY